MSARSAWRSTPARVLAFLGGLAAVFALALAEVPASVHLALSRRSLAPGPGVPVSFQIQDHNGAPVRSYDLQHEKQLHLSVLGTRSLTDFQHGHPTLAADGTWTALLRLAPGTSYRPYADGSTGGSDFVATGDLFTTGSSRAPAPVPALHVTKAGGTVDLEPYLGALGHLGVVHTAAFTDDIGASMPMGTEEQDR